MGEVFRARDSKLKRDCRTESSQDRVESSSPFVDVMAKPLKNRTSADICGHLGVAQLQSARIKPENPMN